MKTTKQQLLEEFKEKFPNLFIRVGGETYSTGQGISNIHMDNKTYTIEQFLSDCIDKVEKQTAERIHENWEVAIRFSQHSPQIRHCS